jgi:hypothetical protein
MSHQRRNPGVVEAGDWIYVFGGPISKEYIAGYQGETMERYSMS